MRLALIRPLNIFKTDKQDETKRLSHTRTVQTDSCHRRQQEPVKAFSALPRLSPAYINRLKDGEIF
jgi:hypothetical protein